MADFGDGNILHGYCEDNNTPLPDNQICNCFDCHKNGLRLTGKQIREQRESVDADSSN